jgi:solute carrier family 25 iron transporter 28/37
VYEAAKKWVGGRAETSFACAALSGAAATVVSDACMTPFDVIKQRLQVWVFVGTVKGALWACWS